MVLRGTLSGKLGTHLPRSFLHRVILFIILPDSQAEERLCVCTCAYGQGQRFLAPTPCSRVMSARSGDREDEGWRLEEWETRMGALQSMAMKSPPDKWEDASGSPLLPPALH